MALAAIYVITAPFFLSFDQYLWGFAHGVIMYGVGMFLFMFAGVGAGDGKFAAAMSMFIPVADVMPVLMVFLRLSARRLCRAPPVAVHPRRAPRHPRLGVMGPQQIPDGPRLAGTFLTYFALAAFTG